jgi:hypothetical protein
MFHWPLSELDELEWSELLHWHKLALERYEAQLRLQYPNVKL